jgi:hypothetical protein
MKNIAIFFPPADGTGLHLTPNLVSLQDEPTAVLVRILPKGNRTVLLHENLAARRGRSGPRAGDFERVRRNGEGRPSNSKRRNEEACSALHMILHVAKCPPNPAADHHSGETTGDRWFPAMQFRQEERVRSTGQLSRRFPRASRRDLEFGPSRVWKAKRDGRFRIVVAVRSS